MPEIFYIGTITFDPNFSLEKKDKLIEEFPQRLSHFLDWKKSPSYFISISKEYHKVDNQDDFEAPHLHFSLISDFVIPGYRVRSINSMLKDFYGRSQFYRATTLKFTSYSTYIKKDCDRLFELIGKSHYYEKYLIDPICLDFSIDDPDSDFDEF